MHDSFTTYHPSTYTYLFIAKIEGGFKIESFPSQVF